jgi:hypothetical protein
VHNSKGYVEQILSGGIILVFVIFTKNNNKTHKDISQYIYIYTGKTGAVTAQFNE